MNKNIEICIAKEFSNKPGSRFIKDGNFSGELFRETILKPKFKQAIEFNTKLLIDFDGTYGYGSSFLDESIGKLAEFYDADKVLDILIFKSLEQPELINQVKYYIRKRKNNEKID